MGRGGGAVEEVEKGGCGIIDDKKKTDIYRIEGYDAREYSVSQKGAQGQITLPGAWVYKRVRVVLLDPKD